MAQSPSFSAYPSVRLFKNPVLEALTHVHPVIPFLVWVPVVIYNAVYSRLALGLSLGLISGWILAGLLVWTLIEYGMHRFVFHYSASSRFGKYLVFLFHGIHHDDPQDPTRLVMPPVVSIALGSAFFYLFHWILGESGRPFFAGFITGYLIYDFIHFSTHHFKPATRWGRLIKENHMKHHFIAHGAKWGVSSPLWDYVFRTFE